MNYRCELPIFRMKMKVRVKHLKAELKIANSHNHILAEKLDEQSSAIREKETTISKYNTAVMHLITEGREMYSMIQKYKWLLDNYEMEQSILRSKSDYHWEISHSRCGRKIRSHFAMY